MVLEEIKKGIDAAKSCTGVSILILLKTAHMNTLHHLTPGREVQERRAEQGYYQTHFLYLFLCVSIQDNQLRIWGVLLQYCTKQ